MRTIRDIEQQNLISLESGLSPDAVARSRQLFGANRLTPLPREPLWKKFLEKFDEPIIKILLAAALLSMFVDLFQHAGVTAAVALVLVAAAVVVALVLRAAQWIPSLLFVSALLLFFAGLANGHTLVEGLAVMI